MSDFARCAVCGWPLVDKLEDGCVRGSCSQRPAPANLYDAERADRELLVVDEFAQVTPQQVDMLLERARRRQTEQAKSDQFLFLQMAGKATVGANIVLEMGRP